LGGKGWGKRGERVRKKGLPCATFDQGRKGKWEEEGGISGVTKRHKKSREAQVGREREAESAYGGRGGDFERERRKGHPA